ncbi:MAG: hypothetical protein HRU20_02060 [Pseudomonadales bacterium]|nr:hypothetical protein [Pseudomonadales bacterium]
MDEISALIDAVKEYLLNRDGITVVENANLDRDVFARSLFNDNSIELNSQAIAELHPMQVLCLIFHHGGNFEVRKKIWVSCKLNTGEPPEIVRYAWAMHYGYVLIDEMGFADVISEDDWRHCHENMERLFSYPDNSSFWSDDGSNDDFDFDTF